jgi:Tfp pilus assembly protein PilN
LEKELPNHKVLVQYLLGELDEAERSEIAERYFKDDALFDELLTVESDLLDKYARGALNEKEQEAFMRYLDHLPDGQQKLAVARTLIQFTVEDRERAQQFLNEYVPVYVPWWQSLLKSPSKQSAMLQYLMAAGLVVMGFGLMFLFAQFRQLRTDNDQLRTQVASFEKEKQSLANARTSQSDAERIRQLEEQLKFEQQANEAQAQHLASLQPTTPVVVSWALTRALRSTGSPDKVMLPHSAKFVSITMPIQDAVQVLGFRAILQTTNGDQRQEHTGLRVNKTGTSVSLKLPASYFTETSYKLTLVRKDNDGAEVAQDFYFTVTRP